MKKSLLIALAALSLSWIACNQQVHVESMFKNPETKDKVFTAILDDHELMTEFMTKMMSSEHAMMMMTGNQDMMGKMMGNGNMMKMMKDNPDMMHSLMGDMVKDGKMMEHMMTMMNSEGMMSDECMQSCMKMMGDKGMSMDMGSKGNNDSGMDMNKKADQHDSHH
ncbi:MAG: hypothetical protein KDD14_24385 [Saprospiraceae bacterium]|nr:hypothetical protein [Saprospiraceae bacterium]